MGWVDVAAEGELPPGTVRAVEVDGRRLALWRTVGGMMAACEARCPHQWADLAEEGWVEGEELVCGAHHWRFDGDGVGSKLTVTGRRDRKGDVGAYRCRVWCGRIEVELPAP